MDKNSSECRCIFCDPNGYTQEERDEIINRIIAREDTIQKIRDGEMNCIPPFVLIPREPASIGHVLVVSGKPYSDIGDPRFKLEHQKEIMNLITALASTMKKSLKSGRKNCRKVYLVSECENPILHLHFHLIPNFDGDHQGHLFLFEKELEEARWVVNKDEKKAEVVQEGCKRIGQIAGILGYYDRLLAEKSWTKDDSSRNELIRKTEEFLKQHKEEYLKN
jgi:diadenosine tetraphosphate (Ap4A) HIT family hydrolase